MRRSMRLFQSHALATHWQNDVALPAQFYQSLLAWTSLDPSKSWNFLMSFTCSCSDKHLVGLWLCSYITIWPPQITNAPRTCGATNTWWNILLMSAMTVTSSTLNRRITPIKVLIFSGPCNHRSFNDLPPIEDYSWFFWFSGMPYCVMRKISNRIELSYLVVEYLSWGSFNNVVVLATE